MRAFRRWVAKEGLFQEKPWIPAFAGMTVIFAQAR
jgi:hypothetical protein